MDSLNGQAKLVAEQVLAIRNDDKVYTEIAKDYNISPGHVCKIKARKRWAWL